MAAQPAKPLKSSCHCGAITVIVPHTPSEINECQCTICRRYSAAWAYYPVKDIKFELKEGAKLSQYIWGDKERSFNFCAECGCVCYHWPIEGKGTEESRERSGINTRMMDPMELLRVDRRIENAWLLQPINNPAMAHGQDGAKY